MHTQQEIDKLAEALRAQGLTWRQTTFAVALLRNAVAAERERCAKLCEAEHIGSSLTAYDLVPEDASYNLALQHASAAIRGA